MKRVGIGIVGSGFAAAIHAEAYGKVYGFDVCLKAVHSTSPGAAGFARKHGIDVVCGSLGELLSRPDVDIVDICSPTSSHVDMVKAVLETGRQAICEKPLDGYFGAGEREVGGTDKKAMYDAVMSRLDGLGEYLEKTGRQVYYAENFVYAPSVQKAREMLLATKGKILLIRGEESHSGSHSLRAARWSESGGGSLIRQGCHPLSAALYLKRVESEARGERCGIASVVADVGSVLDSLAEEERRHIRARPVDVEDWANAVITFSDGTKASITAGDMVVGGLRTSMEVFSDSGVYLCNMAPNDQMRAYHVEERGLENVYFSEKVETKAGWQDVSISEELARGYSAELQDFLECADSGRKPLSGFDLARQTVKVVYGAYVSAERGERFSFA